MSEKVDLRASGTRECKKKHVPFQNYFTSLRVSVEGHKEENKKRKY